MNDNCKNCGGSYGIHHYLTNQCPVGGSECSINQKQEYKTTTFEPDEGDKDQRIVGLEKDVAELKSQVAALLDAVPSAGRKTQ